MAKIAPVEVTRRARAAGLSLSDAAALSRLHESEEDLTEMIKAYSAEGNGGKADRDVVDISKIPF